MMSHDEVSRASQSAGLCTFMEDTPLNGVQNALWCIHRLCSLPLWLYMLLHGDKIFFFTKRVHRVTENVQKVTTNTKRKNKSVKRYTNSKQTYIDTKTLVQSCRNTHTQKKKQHEKSTKCVITLCLIQKQRWGASPAVCFGLTPSCPSVRTHPCSPSTHLWLFVPSWFDQYLCPCRAKVSGSWVVTKM